ncbi:SUMF1/EgtB/PvdO family nonheme iron enzyme [Pseudomonas sp. NPDC087029]|uniref:formylglycine-generating enzyme family protein n=1 Tax=Pseudomonas sp. NPDC087029 TaxID=3364433 RepID=UPI0028DC59C5|nr:SUMF1/EgtB/PvdO family nonheme iron enzyme [uncultured Pseudomonas sp.]
MGFSRVALGLFAACVLAGCDLLIGQEREGGRDVTSEELDAFIREVKDNMIFVEGGEYLMGDYGSQYGPERLPYDLDKDSKPLHRVRLSSYSMSKFKITNREYSLYSRLNDSSVLKYIAEDDQYEFVSVPPSNPAPIDWYEAEKYCSWLADVSQLPFALPTEAQWEYAARSRGRFFMVATDDGTYKVTDDEVTAEWRDGPKGINISTSWDRKAFAEEMGWKTGIHTPLPVDRFAPNPLGLYGMSDNGLEWVKDWYDPDYYKNSPIQDPQGPSKPVYKGPESNGNYAKVLRGISYANPLWGGGVNVQRSFRSPDGYISGFILGTELLAVVGKTARCVVNSATPVN